MENIFLRSSYTVVTTFSLLVLTAASSPVTNNSSDVELQIGIIQRLGEESAAKIEIAPTKGDRLRLQFTENNQQQTLVTSEPIQLKTVTEKLPQPKLQEVLVLGNFRTFETAEDNANAWQKLGIEVEIAQPERWQVWAKRDVYSTPLLRRLLLQSLRASGRETPYLETNILPEIPKIAWEVNGKTYQPQNLEISSNQNLIQVKTGEKAQDRRLYAGRMQLQPNAYGTYTIVNHVPLETYLRGVLPYEIGITAPMAAMEAQAVIARTYALRNLRRFAADDYQLCATTHCQVYNGLNAATKKTDQAIASTTGQVLTYNNELIDALYSSTTGGVTAYFSDVWNGEDRPYLRPVVDTPKNIWDLSSKSLADENNFQAFIQLKDGFNETGWDVFRWRRETSLKDITKDLQKFLRAKKSPYAKLKQVEELSVSKRSPSGRILELSVKSDLGVFTLQKDEIRSAFMAPISTFFYVQPLNKGKDKNWGYAFIGGGLGHGVGLSQTGAQNLAKLGWTSERILQFYYPGTQLQPLNEQIKF